MFKGKQLQLNDKNLPRNFYREEFAKEKKKKKKAGMEASNNGGEMLNVILGCWHGDDRKHKCHCKEIYVSSLNGWSKYKSFGKNSIKGPLFTQQV